MSVFVLLLVGHWRTVFPTRQVSRGAACVCQGVVARVWSQLSDRVRGCSSVSVCARTPARVRVRVCVCVCVCVWCGGALCSPCAWVGGRE